MIQEILQQISDIIDSYAYGNWKTILKYAGIGFLIILGLLIMNR